MKIYLKQTVLEAALDRIRWLFDEFPNVIVNFSGGKDSTVTLNLALQVAEEKGRLPLKVAFIDQEAEWQTVIDYVREIMADPRIEPQWFQVPIKLFNAASADDEWLMCWEPGKEDQWMRPKEPNSIQTNPYGTDRFADLFDKQLRHDYPREKVVRLAGVRASESPARLKGLTSFETYKGETWGKKVDPRRGHFVMYPLYDWRDSDIWKAIHEHGWAYCPLYDYYFQHGVPIQNMRVSNLHHETAVKNLFYLQEIEGDTWERLTRRLNGINTVKHMRDDFFIPRELPWMFESWGEYRDYLLEHLIDNPDHKAWFRKKFDRQDELYVPEIHEKLHKMHIGSILVNDYHGTKMSTFAASNGRYSVNRGGHGGHQIKHQ